MTLFKSQPSVSRHRILQKQGSLLAPCLIRLCRKSRKRRTASTGQVALKINVRMPVLEMPVPWRAHHEISTCLMSSRNLRPTCRHLIGRRFLIHNYPTRGNSILLPMVSQSCLLQSIPATSEQWVAKGAAVFEITYLQLSSPESETRPLHLIHHLRIPAPTAHRFPAR